LFSIYDNPQLLVASACEEPSRIWFQRSFNLAARREWEELQHILDEFHLSPGEDKVVWNPDPWGCYSVSSLYNKLSDGASVVYARDILGCQITEFVF
jgi:hypothetical protein